MKRVVGFLACFVFTYPVLASASNSSAPTAWTESDGNPITLGDGSVWRADRVWPDKPANPEAYVTMPWRDGAWKAKEHHHGGQPRIAVEDGVVLLSARAAASGRPGLKIPALVFVVPTDGWYGMKGEAATRRFDGYGKIKLQLVRRSAQRVDKAREWQLEDVKKQALGGLAVKAKAGEELVLLLIADRAGVDVRLRGLTFGQGLVDTEVKASVEALEVLPKSAVIAKPTREQTAAANAAVIAAGYEPSDVIYPADSNVRNVKAFGAIGDGRHDDTAAFQAALEGGKLVYVPNGAYLITDTLRWTGRQTRTILEGQSRDGAVIKLFDRCPGFTDPGKPKAMIWTGKAPAQRFRNAVRNLTLDVGVGNPGATGLQFIANNQGGVFGVTIRSSDPRKAGHIGLDLGYTGEQGPCLIQHVTVEGFDTGVRTKHAVDGVVAEHITLQHQNQVGWLNDGQCVSLRGLRSENAVTAYHNREKASLTALVDSELIGTGDAADRPAIINNRGLFARNVKTSGYAMAIENTDGTKQHAAGPDIEEFVSHEVLTLFEDTPKRSLNLSIPEVPTVAWDPPEQWVSVTRYEPEKRVLVRKDGKKVNLADWAPALQQAIDSGATTVYFPPGHKYGLFRDVHIRGQVRRIHGMENGFAINHGVGAEATCRLIVGEGEGPVVLERLDITYAPVHIRHEGNRPLLIANTSRNEHGIITKAKGSGDLFINDVVFGQLINEGGDIYARQLNLEGWHQRPKMVNRGRLWVLGYKSEHDATQLHNHPGSVAEIVGGFIYANKNKDPNKIMFINDNALLSVTIGEWVGRKQPFSPVKESRGQEVRMLKYGDAYGRGEGSMVPLFVGSE